VLHLFSWQNNRLQILQDLVNVQIGQSLKELSQSVDLILGNSAAACNALDQVDEIAEALNVWQSCWELVQQVGERIRDTWCQQTQN
jgi:hypothetical protein